MDFTLYDAVGTVVNETRSNRMEISEATGSNLQGYGEAAPLCNHCYSAADTQLIKYKNPQLNTHFFVTQS